MDHSSLAGLPRSTTLAFTSIISPPTLLCWLPFIKPKLVIFKPLNIISILAFIFKLLLVCFVQPNPPLSTLGWLYDSILINSQQSSELPTSTFVVFTSVLLPSSHCSFLWQCNILHLKPDHRSVPGSVQNRGNPVDPMDQIPNSPKPPQRGQSSSTQQANAPFKSDQSAGHEGPATSLAQDEDPTQLFLKLLQTLKTPSSSAPTFRTPGMKPPDKLDGENVSKLRGFLQSCKLLFLNDPSVFSDDRKKVLYAASYLSGRASQWFEPYMDLLQNQFPSCLINNWDQFKQQFRGTK
ncbi:uncharacterized protein VP01_5645g1 [Puccinia sorghi]|uniref:DUF4939 domain-containing protein n=1 Tax=Puccinia sorghi TaxID=27349 RepID=A0A0L6UKZ1_9BASI|nr:uncharacterized protein VP01_5645g1 [Puccinia sorghi]